MKREIQKRKKGFWALCLAILLTWMQLAPQVVYAANYRVNSSYLNDDFSLDVSSLIPNDTITYWHDNERGGPSTIEYYDVDGTSLITSESNASETAAEDAVFSVASYSGRQIESEAFKEWNVMGITGSSGRLTLIKLKAVAYPKSNIKYVINDVEYTSSLNPSFYYEGKGLASLQDESKEGYTFDGWYSDAECTTKVTSIAAIETGDITLYAKFTGDTYNITYVLGEDVTVAGTNPPTYTCGDGVSSFYDAVKVGHTFLGWYETSGDSEVKVEKIPDSRFGHITLKPKFTPATYDINYVLDDGTNDAGNPDTYTYGTGVPNLADATKEGYTFRGWYSENTFTNKVSSIAANDTGDKTLWARFLQNYTITYELNGGTVTTGANPDHYVAGEVVTSFADAAKTGYTFGGWYSDAACTAGNEVTEISATQTGDITLYAKFIVNDYQITYVLDGGTNGEGNPTGYVQGLGVASFADATKTGYTFGGWYSDASFTTAVTSISATQTGNLTLYAKFTVNESRVELQEGVGAIKVNDSYYGESVKPVLASITNGTDHVVITYKKKGADDATYTAEVPVKPGDYTVRAVFAETDVYKEVTVTADFSIIYLEAPKEPCKISGTKGKNSYYTTNVTITPVAGYLIADALDGTYQEKLEFSKTTDAFSVYLKKADTGAKTAGIKMSEIRIDKNAPVISGAKNGETIYGETVKIVVKDANLSRVTVNGKKVAVADEKLVMSLSSDRGEEKYVIIGEDLAGNKKKKTITIAAEWTKKKKIPSGEKVKLYKNRSYSFGTKSFKVSNDDTTYAGNTTFYVGSDGDYIFSETN